MISGLFDVMKFWFKTFFLCNNFSYSWDNSPNPGTNLHCSAPFRLWNLLKPL